MRGRFAMSDIPGKLEGDKELQAITAILDALDGLDGEAIQRVLDYVFDRLSIVRGSRVEVSMANADAPRSPLLPQANGGRVLSIRDLKEEKKPTSSNQMAALVAFYLSELVQDHERKFAISSADIEKYFKQAAFKLPKSVAQTLPNAAAAGYFDSVGAGQYKLNPVGYNLVAHALPRAGTSPDSRPSKKARK
jgi:hypothetical protein